MKRVDVYKLIDGERDYQDKKWEEQFGNKRPVSDDDTPVSSWITYIRFHLAEADKCIYFLDITKALEHIRKVTALGVACMEYNETNPRK